MSGEISPILSNPLGAFGLGVGSQLGTYGNPISSYMMGGYGSAGTGYMNGLGMTGMTGMNGMMGMMGMMDPEYIKKIYGTQFEIEKAQLENTNQMHTLIQQAEVEHLSTHDKAIFQKALVDGDVKNHIRNLADVIRSGDQNAICYQYDKLKQTIYTKYAADIRNSKNSADVSSSVDNIISLLYGQILSTQNGGIPVDLRNDIKKYGESAIAFGFNKAFLGKKGYHDKYTEETMSYCFGTRIDNKEGKDRMKNIGAGGARILEGMLSIPVGAAVGASAGVLLSLAGKVLTLGHTPFLKGAKYLGKWGASIGMAAALLGDIVWQSTRT